MAHRIKQWLFSDKSILPWMAVATFALTRLFAAFPAITETIYSQRLYPLIATVLSFISRWFPFSLDDVLYVLLILGFPTLIIFLALRKIRIKTAALILLNVLLGAYILFYVCWGFNYFRENINQRLSVPERKANKTEFVQVLTQFVNETNQTYTTISKDDYSEIDAAIEQSYKDHLTLLKIRSVNGSRRPKDITFSRFFAQAGISGYYGPFFNEVHINSHLLPVEYPLTLAHEKAHQLGITSEAEANFYAWLICSESNNLKLRYSANLFILKYFIYQEAQLEEVKTLAKTIRPEVKADYAAIRKNWQQLRNEKVDRIAEKVNDTYLKANNVKRGIDDYSGVVQYVMDYKFR